MSSVEQTRDEMVTLFLERPIVAIELGLMQEDQFVELMRSIHRGLKRQALTSLASLGRRPRCYQDILDLARKAALHGI